MTDQRKAAIEAMAEGIVLKRGGTLETWRRLRAKFPDARVTHSVLEDATASLDALLAALPALGLTFPMPVEPDDAMLEDGYYAAVQVRRSAASGMSIEAQAQAQLAREAASYRAMIAAAPNVLGRTDGE